MSRRRHLIYTIAGAFLVGWAATLLFHWLPWGHTLLAAAMIAVACDFFVAGMKE